MTEIRKGQQVTLLCSSFLEDGHCLDTEENEPLTIIAGKKSTNYFSTKISESLLGMQVNEKKQLKVPGDILFGKFDPQKILQLPLKNQHDHFVGKEINLKVTADDEEDIVEGVIVKLDNRFAYVDTNHPFSGHDIIVKLQVISFK